MNRIEKSVSRSISALFAVIVLTVLFVPAVIGQSTAFTYQGRLTDNSLPPTAVFDFEFKLFDSATGGTQVDTTLQLLGVQVSNGIFTVQLDFGDQFPSGAPRFLEISLKNAPGPFLVLSPRQPFSSTPYSIRSLNAMAADVSTDTLNVGGTPAANIIKEGDTRLTDSRTPTAGSANYIQNQNTGTQPSANFNVDGTGSANAFNASQEYRIDSARVLSNGGASNIFVGSGAGQNNTTGDDNSFVGSGAGLSNTTGDDNSFVGSDAGSSNTSGFRNSFVGAFAGQSNTVGLQNSFFGSFAGQNNTTGADNSFFGAFAGISNTTGEGNSFFGRTAGSSTTTGSLNSFFGKFAGQNNTTGASNSFFGANAGQSNTTGFDNSFVGANAGLDNTAGNLNSFFGNSAGLGNTTGGSNSFFGRSAGEDNTTGSVNSFFGTLAGRHTTTGDGNSFIGVHAGISNTAGNGNTIVGAGAGFSNTTGNNNTIVGNNTDVSTGNLSFATAIGANAVVSSSNTIVLGRSNGDDKVRIFGLGAAGSTSLCRNTNNEISTCTAGNLADQTKRLDAVELQNETQAAQIETQAKQLAKQKLLIDSLKALVCQQDPAAAVCR